MTCPGCGKWLPDYSDECWTCGYEFDCSCSCDYDDYDDWNDYTTNKCGYNYVHKYGSGAKQCVCGKWVPGYSKSCWTCGHYFSC